jgi:hypothetical protein
MLGRLADLPDEAFDSLDWLVVMQGSMAPEDDMVHWIRILAEQTMKAYSPEHLLKRWLRLIMREALSEPRFSRLWRAMRH